MSTTEIKGRRETLSSVHGDLKVEDAEIGTDSADNVLRVSGSVICRGDCDFSCDLEAESVEGRSGSLTVGNLAVARLLKLRRGELICRGRLSAERVEIDKRAEIAGALECGQVDVGGSLEVGGEARAESVNVGGTVLLAGESEIGRLNVGGRVEHRARLRVERVSVGGRVVGEGPFEAERVEVGGSVDIQASVDIGEIDVGGSVKIAGGEIRDEIDVGGSLESTRPLRFESIEVGGRVTLSGGEGGDIEVGGTLHDQGDLTFDDIEVGGKVDINGNARGKSIEVGGVLEVSGDLELSGDVRVGGRAVIGERLRADSARVGGTLKARCIEAVDEIEANTVSTALGAKAERVEIGKRGEATGPIIATRVMIGSKASVEDIYGGAVELDKGSTARNIYAAEIELASGVRVTGEVRYTHTIEADENVSYSSQPERVETLPTPPF